MFENKVLMKIFGAKRDEVTGEWRKLHNAELHVLYSSPDIIGNTLRWAGHVAVQSADARDFGVLATLTESQPRHIINTRLPARSPTPVITTARPAASEPN
ncbi:hypothetical protein ANN_07970 [Periplaneta americana]|uniref:Uncharacterized protein n=1 Tax=Periplaneta americana TaxID=6978 RepID=A0ABQ8T035_PERAM|nr:hypothetical protein ANN_07970 [Periplaneta americana]